MKLKIKDTFTKELPADILKTNTIRQVKDACYSFVKPIKTKRPQLIHYSKDVANFLGISEEEAQSDNFLKVFTGNELLPNSNPYAMCYGGHQFGHWAGQLGDGRAINLAEIEANEKRWALQLKGAGRTPYSRTADGLAVLRSSLREYLCSEAMHYLRVPTTRALSLATTGESVLRDILYDGNPTYEKGAIVCRVAPSFLRFGNYQLFSSRNELSNLRKLVNYTLRHFFPHLKSETKVGYIGFFREVSRLTLDMIIHWQRVGFVHGVMNTDNMSILGLTIDYGPYGWLENYDKSWTPNTTDIQHKRYQFGQQPDIALWNLYQLANALYPLIQETEPLEVILSDYKTLYADKFLKMMKAKIGLELDDGGDVKLIELLEDNLSLAETDHDYLLSKFKSVFYKR